MKGLVSLLALLFVFSCTSLRAAEPEAVPVASESAAQLTKHLNKTVIPDVEFWNLTINEAMAFLVEKAAAVDPALKDLKIVIEARLPKGYLERTRMDHLHEKDVTCFSILRYVGMWYGMQMSIGDGVVTFSPAHAEHRVPAKD